MGWIEQFQFDFKKTTGGAFGSEIYRAIVTACNPVDFIAGHCHLIQREFRHRRTRLFRVRRWIVQPFFVTSLTHMANRMQIGFLARNISDDAANILMPAE